MTIVPRTALMPALLRASLMAGVLCASSGAHAEIIDRVIVQVNDEIVTQTDLNRYLPIYVEVFGIAPSAFGSHEACVDTIDQFVTFLTEGTLLLADAADRGLSVSDAEIEDYMRQQYGRMGMTREQFAQELRSNGMDIEDFRDFIELNITRMRMLQLEGSGRATVTEAEVDRAIAELYPDGLEEVYVSTHHIFVPVPPGDRMAEAAALEEILRRQARLRGGESFESVASSNADATSRTGGRLGRIQVLELDSAYARGALGLEVGEVSDPVRSSFGYHLIRLDAIDREPVDDPGAIRERVLFTLQNERATREQELYLDRVVREAFVERRVTSFDFYCAAP
jgi:parvulin-like peptidyl-prolyl isomerase